MRKGLPAAIPGTCNHCWGYGHQGKNCPSKPLHGLGEGGEEQEDGNEQQDGNEDDYIEMSSLAPAATNLNASDSDTDVH